MTLSRISLLLLVYVALDFANPLMPGAVQFEGGSIQTVEADRARPTDLVASIDVVPVPMTIADRPDDEAQIIGRDRLPIELQRRAVIRIRRAPASPPDPAVPSEDH